MSVLPPGKRWTSPRLAVYPPLAKRRRSLPSSPYSTAADALGARGVVGEDQDAVVEQLVAVLRPAPGGVPAGHPLGEAPLHGARADDDQHVRMWSKNV